LSIGKGTYALQEWLERREHDLGTGSAVELKEWADARSSEVEAAKLDRNRAEARSIALLAVVHDLAEKAGQSAEVEALIDQAVAATVGPVETVVKAARELVAMRSDGRWASNPFGMVQQLGARLVDLDEAVTALDAGAACRRRRTA
jgi:hypothetical protein